MEAKRGVRKKTDKNQFGHLCIEKVRGEEGGNIDVGKEGRKKKEIGKKIFGLAMVVAWQKGKW